MKRMEQNTKLALYGAGCTAEYAEKATKELMEVVESIRKEAKKEVFADIEKLFEESCILKIPPQGDVYAKLKEKHLK